jgi:arylsulfatase A-like enzyme
MFMLKKLFALLALGFCTLAARAEIPNVIFIVADDLGYGDLGCYGQKKIKTPHLDKLAAEGVRFTNFYAGSTVCAPSRGSLMTGKHTGHATIRGNKGKLPTEVPLGADEIALPQIFKDAGYKTVMFGKWGVGEDNSSGAPNAKGFDTFLGYLTQHAAHDYYPEWIWRNREKIPLAANAGGAKGTYTHDLFLSEAQKWMRFHHRSPFFLYLPVTIPHANNEEKPNGQQVPSDEPYSKEEWPQTEKNFAAMITRLDSGVGQIMALSRADDYALARLYQRRRCQRSNLGVLGRAAHARRFARTADAQRNGRRFDCARIA